VKSHRELILKQKLSDGQKQACTASIKWSKFEICRGCNCGKGLITMDIENRMLEGGEDCNEWFLRMDSLFRKYFSIMRAKLLVLKMACCDPNRKSKAPGPTDYRDDWAKHICLDQKTKAVTGTTPKSAGTGAVTADGSYRDVSETWIPKMTLTCHRHFQASAETTSWLDWERIPEGPDGDLKVKKPQRPEQCLAPEGDKLLDLKYPGLKPELSGNIVCIEKAYPQEARSAFASFGDTWFPPTIKLNKGSNVLELSCGTQEAQMDMYEGDRILPLRTAGPTDLIELSTLAS